MAQVGGTGPDVSQPTPCTGAAATITWTTPDGEQAFVPHTTSVTASGKITLLEGTNPTYTLLLDGTSVASLAAGNFSHAVTVAAGSHTLMVRATSTSNPTVVHGWLLEFCSGCLLGGCFSNTGGDVSAGGGTTAPATVALTSSVSNSYAISSVSYYRNGTLIGTATAAPYSVSWSGSTQGNATAWRQGPIPSRPTRRMSTGRSGRVPRVSRSQQQQPPQ